MEAYSSSGFRLPPLCKLDPRCSGMLRSVDWYRRFETIGFIFRGQEEGPLKLGLIGCPETSVTKYQSTLRNIPEKPKFRGVAPLILNLGAGCRWVVIVTPGKEHRLSDLLNRRLAGPQSRSERFGEDNIFLLAGFEPRTVKPVARCVYWLRYPCCNF